MRHRLGKAAAARKRPELARQMYGRTDAGGRQETAMTGIVSHGASNVYQRPTTGSPMET
jgi:hypothetical protein